MKAIDKIKLPGPGQLYLRLFNTRFHESLNAVMQFEYDRALAQAPLSQHVLTPQSAARGESSHVDLTPHAISPFSQAALSSVFFKELYCNRSDVEDSIQRALEYHKLIILSGFVGVGKTVLLLYIRQKLAKLHDHRYHLLITDINSVGGDEQLNEHNLDERTIRQHLYKRLSFEFLTNRPDVLLDYKAFCVAFDSEYTDFQTTVAQYMPPDPIVDYKDWMNLLRIPEIAEAVSHYKASPKLETLVKYIQRNGTRLVFVFDNVDMFTLYTQRRLLTAAKRLSNGTGVPTIIAIRDDNLRAVTHASETTIVRWFRVQPFDRRSQQRERKLKVVKADIELMKVNLVTSMITKRYQYTVKHSQQPDVEKYDRILRNEFLKLKTQTGDTIGLVFHALSKTMAEHGIYCLANHSVRMILSHYVDFVSSLLQYREAGATLGALIQLKESPAQRAQLHNTLHTLFYRWLLLENNDQLFTRNNSIPPVFDSQGHGANANPVVHNIAIVKLLSALSNMHAQMPRGSAVSAKMLAESLEVFGFSKRFIYSQLETLRDILGNRANAFICAEPDASIKDSSEIVLLPAGNFFVRSIACSKEYLYWSALSVHLHSDNEIKKMLACADYKTYDTYNEENKLQCIDWFMSNYVFPRYKKEMMFIADATPRDARDMLTSYINSFSINRGSYYSRALDMVLYSIKHSGMDKAQITNWTERFEELRSSFEDVVPGWLPTTSKVPRRMKSEKA